MCNVKCFADKKERNADTAFGEDHNYEIVMTATEWYFIFYTSSGQHWIVIFSEYYHDEVYRCYKKRFLLMLSKIDTHNLLLV
jgi:hypothetical protein